MQVQFFFLSTNISLKNRNKLKLFIATLFSSEKKCLLHLNYIFCSDEFLLQINRDSLKHDYYTDIITFDLSDSKKQVVGEIYISLDRVRDNAQSLSVTLEEELHRVIFHGALHLCNYKDKTPRDANTMRRLEDKYLKKYFK
ncbi:MAG: rRNA maturation RNase YbeY [Ferruginibacter sp.]